MNITEIKQKIKTGELVLYENKLYEKTDYDNLIHAKHQEEHFDLLQLTKKIQLNSALN